MNILHLTASSQKTNSFSSELSSFIVDEILKHKPNATITKRNLAKNNININENFIKYRHLPFDDLDISQKKELQLSDNLIEELKKSSILVIGTPIYNFNAPACLKAWSEQLSRVNITFKKENNKIVGLMGDKKTYVAVSSLSTKIGSKVDFLTPWLKCYLNFIGIQDITFFSTNTKTIKQDIKDILLKNKG